MVLRGDGQRNIKEPLPLISCPGPGWIDCRCENDLLADPVDDRILAEKDIHTDYPYVVKVAGQTGWGCFMGQLTQAFRVFPYAAGGESSHLPTAPLAGQPVPRIHGIRCF